MEQGKHSMNALWCTHSFFLSPSLSLSLSCLSLSLSLFFLLKALELGIFLGLPLEQAEYTFFLSSPLSWDYNHIGFINPPVGKRFPVATVLCVTVFSLIVLKDHPWNYFIF